MIYDLITEWTRYRGVADGLGKAFEYLQSRDLQQSPDGRHEIDGDRVWILLNSYTTEPEQQRRFESHRRYLDIQVVLKGSERIYWSPAGELAPQGPYSDEKDILFHSEPGIAPTGLLMVPGRFALFLPADAHKPNCLALAPEGVRKAVLKVRI